MLKDSGRLRNDHYVCLRYDKCQYVISLDINYKPIKYLPGSRTTLTHYYHCCPCDCGLAVFESAHYPEGLWSYVDVACK